MTHAEVILWNYLRNKSLDGHKFRRQHSVNKYITDFYCPEAKLAVEVDGITHMSKAAIIHDSEKNNVLKSLNIDVFRVTNEEIYDNVFLVIEKLKKELKN